MATATHDHGGEPSGLRSPRRWPLILGALVAAVLVSAGATVAMLRQPDELVLATDPPIRSDPAAGPAAGATSGATEGNPSGPPDSASGPPGGDPAGGGTGTPGECRYPPAPGGSATARPTDRPTRTGPVVVTVRTNHGAVTVELDATKAPCTVNSFVTLAGAGYFTDSPCHRLTTASIYVLQCGDPTGSGAGTPGYRFDDENLPVGAVPTYPRGTVAMANSGPDTNGSQFFLVYRDSPIDPNYPVFGRVTAGMEVVDRVAAEGTEGSDGAPDLEVVVERVDLTG